MSDHHHHNNNIGYVESESEQEIYEREHNKIEQLLLASINDTLWKFQSKQSDVNIYTKSMTIDGISFITSLGIGIIPLTTEAAIIIFNDLQSRSHWFDHLIL
jgi:hypothetical protein